MISNIRIGITGAVVFDGKFDGMRKAQEFIVYMPKKNDEFAVIQSSTRIGKVHLKFGAVQLTPSIKGGAYFVDMIHARRAGVIDKEEHEALIAMLEEAKKPNPQTVRLVTQVTE